MARRGITQAPRPVVPADGLAGLGDVDGAHLVMRTAGVRSGTLPPQARGDDGAGGVGVDFDLVGLPLDGAQAVPERASRRIPVAPRQGQLRNPGPLVEREDLHAVGVAVGGPEAPEEQFATARVLVEIARELGGDERCAPAPLL